MGQFRSLVWLQLRYFAELPESFDQGSDMIECTGGMGAKYIKTIFIRL